MLAYVSLFIFASVNALATYMLWYHATRRMIKGTLIYFFLGLPISSSVYDCIYYVGVKPGMATVVYLGLLGVGYVFVSGFMKRHVIKE